MKAGCDQKQKDPAFEILTDLQIATYYFEKAKEISIDYH
jgi:hypothetical protein